MERALHLFKRPVYWESTVLAVVSLADAFFTILLIYGGHAAEGNPMMAYYLSKGIHWFVVVKVGYLIAGLTACELLRTRNPKAARFLVRFGMYAYILTYVLGDLHINHII
jgi:hypothetical protein